MKITKVLFLVPVFLFFCGNTFAMDMPSAQMSMTHEHCGGTHDDAAISSGESKKKPGSSAHMMNHAKKCKSKACSMKSCCIAPALQASAEPSLDVYFTISNLPVTVERLVQNGSRESVYHPPIILS